METKAFAVAGNLGMPMAGSSQKAGCHMRVLNHTKSRTGKLPKENITVCGTPADAAKDCTVISGMPVDIAVVKDAVSGEHGFARAMTRGIVHVSMNAISPETSQHPADEHAKAGAGYFAAPAFGRPDAVVLRRSLKGVSDKCPI